MFHSILKAFLRSRESRGPWQREPAKRSARGLVLIVRCQAPGKPLLDSSQIFSRAEKRASSSDDDEGLLAGCSNS